ncbi:MAG: PHP domain-containing protein [Clostridium sp.]|nr:PHP domain-containing protein [Clostridium sp.]
MVNVDLHVHTTSSDGLMSPSEVVKRAVENKVKVLAITDHDTISGIDEALLEAKKSDIKVIPGIELSTTHNNESIHVLGFFKDDSYKDPELNNILYTLKNQRVIRAEKMVKKLKDILNIEISFENVLKRGKDVVARPHIAQEIISEGYPYDVEYIFQNFIGKDCPAFVETTKMTTAEGIQLLHKYNALAFLAHPVLIKKSPITDYLNIGLDGIEAVYFQNTPEDEIKLRKFAKENNLLISAGSDCHGNLNDTSRHGDIGSMPLDDLSFKKFIDAINGDLQNI